MTTLTFQNKPISVTTHNNQIWLTVSELGKALGYSDYSRNVKSIYERHADEFTPCMTQLVEMPTAGGLQKVRIFSLRGCHLIGMLSHTKVAKDFRRWVLDILDKETEAPQQLALPEPPRERTYTHTLKESFWRNLAWLWYEAHQENELIARVLPGLEAIASKHAPTAYSQKVEYGNHIRFMADQIYALVKDIPFEGSHAPLRALEAVMQTKQTKRIYR